MFNFVFDRRNDSRPYPNLAPMMDNPHDSYHGMGDTYPFIVPVRLYLYCGDHNYPMNISYTDEPLPPNALYPVGFGWFDYSQDYFDLMPEATRELVRQGQLTVLFYYHEGDNPYREKERLDSLCHQHNLPVGCYRFISGNTEADKIPGFIYFPDHELFYWRNGVVWNGNPQEGAVAHTNPRSKKFTMLSRIHKWWRGTIVAYFKQQGLLDNSFWSYNTVSIGDKFEDNPIQLSKFDGLREYLAEFLEGAPYTCDDQDATEHNSHWMLAKYLYEDSYCSFVLETLYDAEQSGGAFLTEKTFKAIRNGHPFVIFGCPNTLGTLRRLGYRTFDDVMFNGYDEEQDNTQRFIKTIETVNGLINQDMHAWYMRCYDDIIYNQNLFVSSKYSRLAELRNKINIHVTRGAVESVATLEPVLPYFNVLNNFKKSSNYNTCHIDTTHIGTIEAFNCELNLVVPEVDTVILTDEIWKGGRQPVYNNTLLTYNTLINKNVIVLTHEYSYNQLAPNTLIASYPVGFLMGNYYNNVTPSLKSKNLPYGFSCLNRRAAPHRLLLGYRLHQQNLLNQIIFTQGVEDIEIWANKFNNLLNFNDFKNLLPINSESIFPIDFTIDHPAYTDAYCNIVTETQTEYQIITEKSYKPFISKQIPIFLAGKGHLAYLKSLGFEVFEDLLPLEYDQMSTDEKVSAIVDIVSRGTDFIREFYFSHLTEIEHNYELYTSGRVEQQLIQQINSRL